MEKYKTAEYRLLPAQGGNRYSFICGVTGAQLLTDRVYQADDAAQELSLARQTEGRTHFNQCSKCGRWVFDVAYNPEVLECIECAPFEKEARFCKSCGVRVPAGCRTCPACGKMLYYEGVNSYDAENEASGA